MIIMEKLCVISNKDPKILKGVSPDYLQTLWIGISYEQKLDIYSDDNGKLFTSLIMPNESICFIPMVKLKNRIFYEKIDLYLQSPNYPEQNVNEISSIHQNIIDEILQTAPKSNDFYRVWIKTDDYSILRTEHPFGIICNAVFSKEAIADKKTYPLYSNTQSPNPYGFIYKEVGNIWF